MPVTVHVNLFFFWQILIDPLFLGYIAACWRSLLLLLSRGPRILNAKGIGIMITAKQPSRVDAHCTPRFSNICLEKSGNPAAIAERSIMLAATADAALSQLSQLFFMIKTVAHWHLTLVGTRRQGS